MRVLLLILILLNVAMAGSKIDDWDYNATQEPVEPTIASIPKSSPIRIKKVIPYTGGGGAFCSAPNMSSKKMIGFSVGGAKDANNFYDNIANGYLPKIGSITYEGVFYNHYFDTGKGNKVCKDMFCPSYTTAVQKSIFNEAKEYYLSVGLNSNIKDSDFKRKKLNIVVVLDISGSMGSSFDQYYYDHGKKIKSDSQLSKIKIANQAIVAMIKHLKGYDSLGVVLFDDRAYRAKPLRRVELTDMKAIKKHILDLTSRGGTNWSAGYKAGVSLFKDALKDPKEYENRIIFLTDAMPNRGELSKKGLFGMVDDASKKGIFTTFIGIGVDFNSDLVEQVSKTKGANYFAVHSLKEFKKRLDEEFDYMVTPLVFDLKMSIDSENYEIKDIYGSPEADKKSKTVMFVNTLFPSKTEDEKTKGGVILVKLKKIGKGSDLKLKVSYKTRDGKVYTNTQKVELTDDLHYDNSGIKKAILLSEYVSVIKNWIVDTRASCNNKDLPPIAYPTDRCCFGCYTPEPWENPNYKRVKTWEKHPCQLKVSQGYKKLFSIFAQKYKKDMKTLGDKSLEKEYKTLKQLINYKKEDNTKVDDWVIGR